MYERRDLLLLLVGPGKKASSLSRSSWENSCFLVCLIVCVRVCKLKLLTTNPLVHKLICTFEIIWELLKICACVI